MSGASRLRFWGKIYGTQKDYWVVEGILDTAEEDTTDRTQEQRGVGTNRYVYWVTDNLLEDWIHDFQQEGLHPTGRFRNFRVYAHLAVQVNPVWFQDAIGSMHLRLCAGNAE